MKYKNVTGREVQVRIDDGNGSYIWKIIEENKEVEIPEDYAERLGFVPSESIKPLTSSVSNNVVETKKIDAKHLEQDIDKIKGIGKKKSKEINKVIEDNFNGN